uniref:Methyltranfer_dom domain-containing protein n=1 Tax=Macrostomum lignano TaxID=282301 RepID=A0A1I8FSR5_9PLAT
MLCACSAGSLPQLRHALNTCLSVVQLFSGVVDSYVSDYFVADLKQLVKPCLFYHLNESCPPCLANIIVPLEGAMSTGWLPLLSRTVISWLHQRVHQPELEPLVVDAGSGLGHLSRHLSVELGLPVLAIEGASHHGPAAAELDLRAQRLHRVQSAASGCTPQHRCQVLQSGADLLAQCPADRPLLL